MKRPVIIAVTGGIGSGKSVICKVLRAWGYDVFNCDYEAKMIMDSDGAIKRRLCDEIATEILIDDMIDRRRLAEIVFSDKEKLSILNGIVHQAVRDRFANWVSNHMDHKIVFVETAILYSSGMNADIDYEWRVSAPEKVRIDRVIKRNGLSARQVKDRMASQLAEETVQPDLFIINDGHKAVSPQLLTALRHYLKS